MDTQQKIFKSYDKRMMKNDTQLLWQSDFINNVFYENYRKFLPSNMTEKLKILEVGCNKGFMCKALRSYYQDAHIVGVDLSPNDIEYAKKLDPHTVFLCTDAREILKNNTFDIIISKDVMEHIPKTEQEAFVKSIYYALLPNGTAIIQVPNMDWILSNHERYMDYTHEIGYTRESLADIFRLYFGENINIVPSSYIWPKTLKQKILFSILRPIVLRLMHLFFKVIGEGADDIWYHSREIMIIAKK